eukprot:TRINITY_DN67358_c0_g1_i1.p1 TRINITY_DN67358_c0_g1~~TRINITY_DN67358_c0_g1_i1.p1  ORF type:complete len:391 (-),score=68.13 TRINITY_DN67358_c0_g1_i1:54-1226(-)
MATSAGEGKNQSTDIAELVKDHILTWKEVDISQIEVKEVSGLGGSKTFKVSLRETSDASGASVDTVPAAVAFHARSELNNSLLEERTIEAGRAFASAGIGPKLLAEAEDRKWCINEWAGEAIVEKFAGPGCHTEATGVAAAEKLTIWSHAAEFRERAGHLLGRVHRVPTNWAEFFVASKPFLLTDRYPTLGFLGQNILHTQSLDDMPPLMLERWGAAIGTLETSHALAQRTVTLHADFHGGNILIMGADSAEARLCAIDFEFANVGQAEFDLGYVFVVNKALLNNSANKRAFVKGYVEAVAAASSDPQDVENLLVDCELASVKAWPPSEFIGVPDTDVETYRSLVRRLAGFCGRARVPADPLKAEQAAALREELLEKGAFALMREWHNKA